MVLDAKFNSQGGSQDGLPLPDVAAQAQSARLERVIENEMTLNSGRLTFARFMELALYTPGLGYYTGGSHKLGAEGDFMTAPEWSSLFSRCLARQVAQVLIAMGSGDLLEVGGGSGIMAADILEYLYIEDCLPQRYYILERSAELRERQQALLKKRLPLILDRIEWLDQLPEPGFCGVVVANELLDALPVHCFEIMQEEIAEMYVERIDGRWRWCRGAPSSMTLVERIESLKREGDLPADYISEINLAAEAWISSIADIMTTGVLLLVDYGFSRREFYHPDRTRGTLMCHFRHRAHGNPLILVGLQDITAHVDFTAMAEAGFAAGLKVGGYTTQAAFLLANGIGDFINETDNELIRLERAQHIKKLTLPHEMGELFKVLALTRNFNEPLRGFSLHDLSYRL